MKNFDYEKKYHFLIKYIVIGLPILLLLICNISYNSNFDTIINLISNALTEFRNLPINNWYNTLINSINLTFGTDFNNILITYPLYIIWVYILDLIVDIFAFVPKLAHKLLYKLGGK